MSYGGTGSNSRSRACRMGLPSAERRSRASHVSTRQRQPGQTVVSTSLRVLFLWPQKIPEYGLDRLSLLPLQKFPEQGLASCWVKGYVSILFVLISNDCRGGSVDGLMWFYALGARRASFQGVRAFASSS